MTVIKKKLNEASKSLLNLCKGWGSDNRSSWFVGWYESR